MTRLSDTEDEIFRTPEVVAEADLVWRPGSGEQQNPTPHSYQKLESPLMISNTPGTYSDMISNTHSDVSTKSSRAVERIRAMKDAFKNQIREASGLDSNLANRPEPPHGRCESIQDSQAEMIAYLQEKLKHTTNSLLELKALTFSLISSQQQQLQKLQEKVPVNLKVTEEAETVPLVLQHQECMVDLFDEVLDTLCNGDICIGGGGSCTKDDQKACLQDQHPPHVTQLRRALSGRKSRGLEIGSDSDMSRATVSRSSSPEARIRRRQVSNSDLPAPGGGFRRLANMNSNAFLATAGSHRLSASVGKTDSDPSKIKFPMKAVVGQFSLISESSDSQKKESFRRRRRSGWNGGSLQVDREPQDTIDSASKSAPNELPPHLPRLPSQKAKKSAIVIPQSWYERMLSGPRNLLSRMFCLNASLDEDEKTIGPYVRFVWILSLGFMDFFLVLVLLFWPERDFMCMTSGGSYPGVIEEGDIIASIGAILGLHLGDVLARMRSRDTSGRRIGLRFFSPKATGGLGVALFNVWDCFIIVVSGVIAWGNNHLCRQYIADDSTSYTYRIVKRLHIIIHIVRCMVGIQKCVRLGKHFKRRLQRAVSMNKRRFIDPENRFDLDLTYICDRLIVMAIPCVDGALYRNDIREVARFFATRHYGRFLVFNLCEDFETNGNGCYDCMLLYDQVQKLPFRDHNVPPLFVLVGFCRQATAWLNKNPFNVVAVHCQGGKGRSGTFCSSLMLWNGFGGNAEDVLEGFTQRRTDPRIDSRRLQGVAAPCQIRYVHYIERIVRGHDYVSSVRMLLTSITMYTMPLYTKKNIAVSFIIESMGTIQYDYCKRHGLAILARNDDIALEREEYKFELEDVLVDGDVTIRFYSFEEYSVGPTPCAEVGPGARTIKYGTVTGKELCFVTFHTSFHTESVTFSKSEIDGAYDKTSLEFLESFSISVSFQQNASVKDPLVSNSLAKRGASHIKEAVGCGVDAVQDKRHKWKSIPYGISAGPRLLRLYEATEEIMTYACPEVITFTCGQLMYDPEEPEFERSLYLIVEGVAEYDFINKEEQENRARINRGDSIAGLCIGAGHFYGELKFLLGNEGDPSSFCLRASSGVVKVRVLRMSGNAGNCSGVVPTACRRYPVAHFATIFEVLSKSLSTKARDLALHISRLSIKPSNVKRDAHVRAREARLIQKVVKELHMTSTDYDIKTAPATLFSKNGSETAGILLAFTNEVVFFANSRFGRRRKNLRLFLKDIPNVSSFGEKLSLFVAVDKVQEQNSSQFDRSKSIGTLRDKFSYPDRFECARSTSPSRTPSPGTATISPSSEKRSFFGLKPIFQEQAVNISSLATVATSSCQDELHLCLHFSLPDAETCTEMKTVIMDRIFDIQMASINFQKEAYHTSEKLRGSELMFGYILPDEIITEEDREAVNQIFMQAKSFSYKNGEIVLRRGSVERKLFHILSGTAACLSQTGQLLVRLGPGEIFGEISFLDSGDTGAGANVVAEGNVECLVVVHETMEMLATLQPLVGLRFWRSLAVATAFRMRQQYHAVESRRVAEHSTHS